MSDGIRYEVMTMLQRIQTGPDRTYVQPSGLDVSARRVGVLGRVWTVENCGRMLEGEELQSDARSQDELRLLKNNTTM